MSEFAGYARGPNGEATLGSFDWLVRNQVYASFAQSGEAPSVADLAAIAGSSPSRVKSSLLKLHDAHEIAARDGGDGVWMAHPFSAVPTGYAVETPRFSCYANCAWDALGIPAILGEDVTIETACPASGEPVELEVEGDSVIGPDDVVVHLLTPLRDAWDDIGFT
jgi:hypothetical protein